MTKTSSRLLRRTALTSACAALALTITACGSGGSATDGSSRHLTIAYVPGVTPNPYYDTVERGMKKVAQKEGVTLVYQGAPSFDPAAQTKVLDAVLTQHPDLLLAGPVDPVALRAPIARFLRAKIPVITVDGPMKDESGITAAIQNNALQGGRLAGAEMARLTHGTGTVAVINIASGNTVLDARVKGFTEGLRKAAPGVRLAPINNAGGNPSASQSAARSLLLAYPDLKGIFGVTEANAEGAAAGIKAAGKSSTVPIIGWDASPAEVALLKAGTLTYLVASQAEHEGELAMTAAIEKLRGKKSTVAKHVQVDTVGVSLKNVDDPSIAAILYHPAIK